MARHTASAVTTAIAAVGILAFATPANAEPPLAQRVATLESQVAQLQNRLPYMKTHSFAWPLGQTERFLKCDNNDRPTGGGFRVESLDSDQKLISVTSSRPHLTDDPSGGQMDGWTVLIDNEATEGQISASVWVVCLSGTGA